MMQESTQLGAQQGAQAETQQTIKVEDVTNEESQIRQNIYSLLAHLFRTAPDAAALEWLAELETDQVENSGTQDSARNMAAAWSVLKLTASKTSSPQAADEYQQMFIGIGRGEVVPFGSWYLTGSLMEVPLILLREDLRRLGFERQQDVKEPEDHFAALLEVMAMLAGEGTETEQAEFFNRHIATWFERLCGDIKQSGAAVFYAAVAELTLQFLVIEKTRFTQRPW